ncbi:Protein of unknown function [Actinopolymorpha cephalotaxi]|uniref:SMODS and SLOG-associating 2TM effector domain-containing protein n=1 Tax=Actinopolymorpha cephalotaxi TaxID=504797 RepID=A0A1I2Y4D9_9ACTN|nr:DUF4231 domain-containing protein [Actinopolymorpha cephalotaxi]NYH87327.1 hypothetical protein [Actinopolymorpha cephalotaxi]SFH20594.1 Protein of unknown function [Actinopolymorpha cephalotaxi]
MDRVIRRNRSLSNAGDLPSLYSAGDTTSNSAQGSYLTATALRSVLAIAAAAVSVVFADSSRELAFVVAIIFLLIFGVEAWLWAVRPERRWYDGRAVAESVKTLAWRFSVCGLPFAQDHQLAEDILLDRLERLLKDAPATGILPSSGPVITEAMLRLREEPLDVRRTIYINERVDGQCAWYRIKARRHSRSSAVWRGVMLSTELAAIILAVARGAGWIHLDLASVAASVVTGAAAWLAVCQHEALARAYTFAHGELSVARERLNRVQDEPSWGAEVSDTEEAISREHTMWHGSRSFTTM